MAARVVGRLKYYMEKKIVLLIEDDETDQQLFTYLLNRLEVSGDWKVVTSKLLSEALQKIDAIEPHIVFIDLKLPDELGVNVVRKVRHNTNARLVVLSGTSDPQVTKDSLDCGAAMVYSKDSFNENNLSSELAVVAQHYH